MKNYILLIVSLLTCFSVGAQHNHSHAKADTGTQRNVEVKKTGASEPQTKRAAGSKASKNKSVSNTDLIHNKTNGVNISDTGKSKNSNTSHDHSGTEHNAGNPTNQMNSGSSPGHSAHTHSDQLSSHSAPMSHAFSLNLPMNRNGSGTGWLPDNSPMFGYMFHKNKWMYMLHGNAFLRYNKQDLADKGKRGGEKFDLPNMVMLMGQRRIGNSGLFHFNTMLSFDPVTIGGEGYPLLFQTGETYKGVPLVDRQHPHDFISELSVSYSHALSPKADVFAYIGYPGEPALGPVAFMHRPSAMYNPDAPLSHHWLDATHVTFGVATVGFRYGNFKVEASSFTGREPDENRYDFDKPRFDSWSGRLSYNPSEKWALQVSHGFIKEPEALHAGENVNRTTASTTYSTRGYGNEFINITALWGMNKTKSHNAEHAALLEGSYARRKLALYGRYEWVQKSLEELNLDEHIYGHDAMFPVHAFTAGVGYDILKIGQTKISVGTQFTLYNPDDRLTSLYGDNPLAGQVYLRVYPQAMGRNAGRLFLPY